MAGALDIALAGPRVYPDRVVEDPFLNAGGRLNIGAGDMTAALRVFLAACILHGACYGLFAVLF